MARDGLTVTPPHGWRILACRRCHSSRSPTFEAFDLIGRTSMRGHSWVAVTVLTLVTDRSLPCSRCPFTCTAGLASSRLRPSTWGGIKCRSTLALRNSCRGSCDVGQLSESHTLLTGDSRHTGGAGWDGSWGAGVGLFGVRHRKQRHKRKPHSRRCTALKRVRTELGGALETRGDRARSKAQYFVSYLLTYLQRPSPRTRQTRSRRRRSGS